MVGVSTAILFILCLGMATVGILWYRNGKSFDGMSEAALALARGYGRAPTSASDERDSRTSVEMEDRHYANLQSTAEEEVIPEHEIIKD